MADSIKHIARQLSESEDPHIRYKIMRSVYQRPAASRELSILREEIAVSPLVSTLLAEVRGGSIDLPVLARWRGAHWVLHVLADIGSAAGDSRLYPLANQVLAELLSSERTDPISGIIEGHALHYLHFLGLADERTNLLADRLIQWSKNWYPGKTSSSFAQALAALRGLYLHAQCSDSPLAQTAAEQIAHSLLDCHLYCKPGTSDPLGTDFVSLHYPCYDSADVLFALKVMSETGYATDPRSSPAVQLLRSKQLADGTFPAERKHYRAGRSEKGDDSLVNWGGTHRARGNIFVTLDALGSLRAAGERF